MNATASHSASLDVTCPHCGAQFDLLKQEDEEAYGMPAKRLLEAWWAMPSRKEIEEFDCPECEKELTLRSEDIEW